MGASPLRGLSLCSGIGGLELGLHLATDYRTVCAVEWDRYAQSILIARQADGTFDPFPIWDDVKTFDGHEWRGRVDILTAGYPCQPFSLAGNRKGTDDPRHLWPHVARIIGECQPSLVFLENVPGHLSLGFDAVGVELCQLGYRFAAGLFSAAEVGASHNRERLFVLAHAVRERRQQVTQGASGDEGEDAWRTSEHDHELTSVGTGLGHPPGSRLERAEWSERQGHRNRSAANGRTLDNSTLLGRREGWPESVVDGGRHPATSANVTVENAKGAGSSPERELPICEPLANLRSWKPSSRLSLFPPGPSDADAWRAILAERPDLAPAVESPVRVVADGLPRRVDQLKALGNAVVPLVAAKAFTVLAVRLFGEGGGPQRQASLTQT